MSHPRVKTLTRRLILLLALLPCFASTISNLSGETGDPNASVMMAPSCKTNPEHPGCIPEPMICFPIPCS